MPLVLQGEAKNTPDPRRRRLLEAGAVIALLITIILPSALSLRTWYLNRELAKAMDNGERCAAILARVRRGASVRTRSSTQETPLHVAAASASPADVLDLIQRGADLEAQAYLRTPLMCAAYVGRLDNVQLLLAHGANPNRVCESVPLGEDSPLCSAAEADRLAVIRALVAAGADVNLSTQRGGTPLAAAGHYEKLKAMKLLLKLGADINRPSRTGVTPLMRTVWLGKHRAARFLLEHGAQVNARDARGRTALGLLFEQQEYYLANWGQSGVSSNKVRHLAEDYRTMLRLLIQHGARE